MLSKDKIERDWIFNGCIYFHMRIDGNTERFICDKNLNLGFTRERMYEYCTRECKKRIKQNNWVI